MKLVLRFLINGAAIWITAAVLSGMTVEGGLTELAIVALVFGLVNALIRPLAKLLTLPIRVATLGLFTLVINTFMVILTSWIVDDLVLEGDTVEQIFTAFLAALIISVISTVLSWVLPDGR